MIAKGKDCSDLFPAVVKNVVSKNSEVIANKTYKYHSLTKECPPTNLFGFSNTVIVYLTDCPPISRGGSR